MNIDTDALISITEANQNFSKVTRLVDKTGSAIILKNNVPRYLVIEFNQLQQDVSAPDEDVRSAALRILNRNKSAFEELAK